MFNKNPTLNQKPLRHFTDLELYEVLERNTQEDLLLLAGICSEVLRRRIKKEMEGE
jgi:hypothetical protein